MRSLCRAMKDVRERPDRIARSGRFIAAPLPRRSTRQRVGGDGLKKVLLGAHHELAIRKPIIPSSLPLLRRLADVLTGIRPPHHPPSHPHRAPSAAPVRGGVGDVPCCVPRGWRARGVPVRALPPLDHPLRRRRGWGQGILAPAAEEVPCGGSPWPPPLPGGPRRLRARHPHPLHRYLHNTELVKQIRNLHAVLHCNYEVEGRGSIEKSCAVNENFPDCTSDLVC